MTEDIDLIHSPLTQTYSADGHSLRVLIYRLPDTQWSLEVVDEQGTSTVWDDLFETDKQALEEAIMAIESEGIGSFISKADNEAKAAEHEAMFERAFGSRPSADTQRKRNDRRPPVTRFNPLW